MLIIGIVMFIGGILMILLGSPEEVHYIGSICSIGGVFLSVVYMLTENSRATMTEMREMRNEMMAGFAEMREYFTKLIELIKELPKQIASEIKK